MKDKVIIKKNNGCNIFLRGEKIFWILFVIFMIMSFVCVAFIHPVFGRVVWIITALFGIILVLYGIWYQIQWMKNRKEN